MATSRAVPERARIKSPSHARHGTGSDPSTLRLAAPGPDDTTRARLWRMTGRAPALYLNEQDVSALMPPVEERLVLAERALRALGGAAQLPPKIGVHPRPEASWAHAMPAWVPGADPAGTSDLLGVKFVSGFPANAASGLPALYATLVLVDPLTGRPTAVLDAGPITAARTAAISGVVVATWGRTSSAPVVGIVGAGIQAEAHVQIIAAVAPGGHLRVHDRDPRRATDLAQRALGMGAFASVETSPSAESAVRGADIALTMVSFGPDRQSLPAEAFEGVGLIVTVDYDMCLPAATARRSAMFVVDEVGQFQANRATGIFEGFPDPAGTIGEALDRPRPAGQVVATHLGTGVADLVFGDAILRAAIANGLGTSLG
jgi:ornithine cyclodeaminase/alanine dehydrogenase-like protein (mu-crystallin family)